MDDATLWNRFHDRTLPQAEWTHTAHLRVAWMHLARYPLDEAHLRMRIGIIRLNHAHGLEETISRGYHETITRAWLAYIGTLREASISDTPGAPGAHGSSEEFLAAHAERLGREALLRFYSRERLFSLEARTRYVPPDITPV